MAKLTNPSEIARETLRLLATRRTPPTPDNYLTIYHEIAGTRPAGSREFPDQQLRTLAAALPRATPDQLRLARQLEDAVARQDWETYRTQLAGFVEALAQSTRLGWSELIGNLIGQWDARHPGITVARKRESLEHVLKSASASPETLFNRLNSLMRSWGEGLARSEGDVAAAVEAAARAPTTPLIEPSDLLPQLRELFAFTLESAIATQLMESPQLASDARVLAADIRNARTIPQLQEFLTRLKRFAFKLELLAEDQAELRRSLHGLLRLFVENISELMADDQWLHGQVEVVRELIDKPLSQRALDDAERRLKEVLFKQGQLKQSLDEARESLKSLLAGFVDQLAGFADATSDYHDKIEVCADKISAARDISELGQVLSEVMHETRAIQTNARRSRDELRTAQDKVRESESRIRELEQELAATSDLVRYDQLTGVLNRRGLEEMFAKETARARRHDTVMCVGLLDIDNFKRLNDSMGHAVGDQALVHLATVCRETLRPQDTVARFGGEEFIILLPETPLEDAAQALTRLQRELTRKFFMHDNEKVLITFSAGVTQLREDDDQTSVLKRADEAMYQAKQTGKNRVVQAP